MKTATTLWSAAPLVAGLLMAGCSSVYYGGMEKLGIHKRDILVDRVDDARKSQEAAKEQFASALERFLAVTQADTGDLQSRYDALQRELNRSETRAKAVSDRIAAIEDVAGALFREWRAELGEYTDANLRRASERQLAETRRRYDGLITSMRQAERRMEPVLGAFRDQTLFLKHNLNARAIAALGTVSADLERDIRTLIAEMERSIAEAASFIEAMRAEAT
jgi:hypothetical protein